MTDEHDDIDPCLDKEKARQTRGREQEWRIELYEQNEALFQCSSPEDT